MSYDSVKRPELPQKLLDQIGGVPKAKPKYNGRVSKYSSKPLGRKEQRKADRQQKKTVRNQPRNARKHIDAEEESEEDSDEDPEEAPVAPVRKSKTKADPEVKPLKSILKKPDQTTKAARAQQEGSASPPPRVSKAVKSKLAEDDDEIAALEKKLGLKGKKNLPKAFADDGLDELLNGLDGADLNGQSDGKRKRSDYDEYLQRKRQKANSESEESGSEEDEDEDGVDLLDRDDEEMELDSDAGMGDEDIPSLVSDQDEDEFEGFDSEASEPEPVPKKRENPYIAPVSNPQPAGKYVPPSKRGPPSSDAEALQRLRRQLQGLINKLSEANIHSILKDVEGVYQNNPRQYVSSTIIDILIDSVSDRITLSDTFMILHAGFVAALYKIIGTDFGAQVIERIVSEIDEHYRGAKSASDGGKVVMNLISLLAFLYTFHVVGCNLIFDYIRLFLEGLSDENTDLLLKIVRNCGQSLRSDDPSALKDIVILLQKAVSEAGDSVSVKTKFTVEFINDLKNNRQRAGVAASAMMAEHSIRMKKTLGSLNSRTVRASEPLRIGLADIRNTEKKGKWWLVGASWQDPNKHSTERAARNDKDTSKDDEEEIEALEGSTDVNLLRLAKEYRMNTDIRRAIFITILSSSDYKDAYNRILKLKLRKRQELEIPRVLVQCAGSEKTYNPFYTLIAKKFCSEHRMRFAFQGCLWDLFRSMGEKHDEDEGDMDEEEDSGDEMDVRKIVNLARMFGALIADGCMAITMLKPLNFAFLQPKTITFVEVLIITLILQSQKGAKDKDKSSKTAKGSKDHPDPARLTNIILRVKETQELAPGLQYFLEKKLVGHADALVDTKADMRTVKWGLEVIGKTLFEVIVNSRAGDQDGA
ncbi:hypothetical protein K402DRAFT_465878 [Aulographum hederae CBS 113979]|uniref:MI domain-containing protein n=1 Tax=Aulographum hederae CBS 113979 TaxID=1176131 RepID=A0A6G1GRV4_9PEZI|nr:hypothetical protein K402DRAFT_465878 [Aulographum hederae CBS 113979]